MKTTGHSTNGDFIVEMTPQEHAALSYLAESIEGKGIDFIVWPSPEIGMDMSTTFGAIVSFAQTRRIINDLQSHLDKIKDTLAGNNEPTNEPA